MLQNHALTAYHVIGVHEHISVWQWHSQIPPASSHSICDPQELAIQAGKDCVHDNPDSSDIRAANPYAQACWTGVIGDRMCGTIRVSPFMSGGAVLRTRCPRVLSLRSVFRLHLPKAVRRTRTCHRSQLDCERGAGTVPVTYSSCSLTLSLGKADREVVVSVRCPSRTSPRAQTNTKIERTHTHYRLRSRSREPRLVRLRGS